ncbi:MAG: glycosyl hydrolase family 8, partial [Acidimicrobiales bacterium]
MSRGRLAAAVTVCVLVGTGGAAGVLQGRADQPMQRAALEHRDPGLEQDGRRFVSSYVDDDGRVVRHDHGGDTVSEGQAYGMLVAVALRDRPTFDAVWRWTEVNLQRPDGLLSWRWEDGEVVGEEPAADADLDAAWALALAADLWPDGRYREAGARIA